jgi:hypothetical protein
MVIALAHSHAIGKKLQKINHFKFFAARSKGHREPMALPKKRYEIAKYPGTLIATRLN